MNINNVANVIIDYTISFFNRLDLLMLTKVNKRFNRYKSDPKSKNIKFLVDEVYKQKVIICTNAAYEGYLDILIYLRKSKCDWGWETCAYAALNGHLEVLKWTRVCETDDSDAKGYPFGVAHRCDWNYMTCECAASEGHLEILKWAIEN